VEGRRWTRGDDHEFGKEHFGFDRARVRRYRSIYRPLVLVMAALAVCALTVARARPRTGRLPAPSRSLRDAPPGDPGLIPLTVPEVKRLFNLLPRVWHATAPHLRWSRWRRRHQARARWFHRRARLNKQEKAT
jgi:hypothetical protein